VCLYGIYVEAAEVVFHAFVLVGTVRAGKTGGVYLSTAGLRVSAIAN
jgi:hypothetical protein